MRATMKPDFQFVRTVSHNEIPTHEKVQQKVVECRGLQNSLPALYELCSREIDKAAKGMARTGIVPY